MRINRKSWFFLGVLVLAIATFNAAAFSQTIPPSEETPTTDSIPNDQDEAAAPSAKPAEENSDILPPDFFKNSQNQRASSEANFTGHAKLQGLNKITAHISAIDIEKGKEMQFGTLTVALENCWKSSPGDAPESAALLKITEQKTGEEKRQIFFGWMFAASPSLNALEHSVYDVVVLECY